MHPDLTDDEARALAERLRRGIASDPFPLSPRLRTLRSILANHCEARERRGDAVGVASSEIFTARNITK
jgi:hypothetical protein